MNRLSSSAAMNFHRQLLAHHSRTQLIKRAIKPCEVFINHRGIDTKKTIATLLYDYLHRFNLRPFLDNKTMKPGDKLFEKIDGAIQGCKIGVAVFSPNYCKSYFCLHELALFMESKKKVIPIFCDIKPSQLSVPSNGVFSENELRRFRWALEEAKHTVGLTFDSFKGNITDVVTSASEIVIESLIELENEEHMKRRKSPLSQ
ncbi:probable 2' cyclic ADP-D-ribose synthase BdTIR [Corylus avellana]|uniref:probable 2' cyclic ADP-D-ribose synthase BdTIR n=1 Tax=Corylus avellana TaxID=13451 RepID=UPI001E224CAB|nr:probable 2' cyclic ADP-D-ribose synthase BdTIR [Corylus avellana]